jgi:hypothetical protein
MVRAGWRELAQAVSGDHARMLEMFSGAPEHMRIVREVTSLGLRDCWVAAGFVRSLVWDRLHGRNAHEFPADVDVIYFDPADASLERDQRLTDVLKARCPGVGFSVKNQVRMAQRNGHRSYSSSADAMSFWPETCTAVGIAASDRAAGLILCAPFGTEDLTSLIVRPTATDSETIRLARERLSTKHWRETWPRLTVSPELE